MNNPTDTNQASELETKVIEIVATIPMFTGAKLNEIGWEKYGENEKDAIAKLLELIRTEKLKLLNELDKSMPTAEQLTTKYGYHMPEKQYGYKLALHDIREVLTKLEAEL